MRRFIRGAAALLLGVCASCLRGAADEAPAAEARSLAARDWLELTSPHFTLRTELDEPAARAALLDLERTRLALLTGAPHAKTLPPGRTHVILLASERALNDYVRRGVVGFAATDPFEAPLLVASASRRFDQSAVLKHELAHQQGNQYLLRQPRWLSEGLAIYLETMTLAPDGRSVTLGDIAPERLAWLRRHPQLRLERVLHAGAEILHAPADEVESFYAQSWLLTHYLINARRAQLEAWIDSLARAGDPDLAWANAFGALGAEELERELRGYLRSGEFKTWTYALPAQESPIAARPLPRADAMAEGALLRSISLGRKSAATDAQAAREADEALAEDPRSVLALGIWLATGERKIDAAIAAATRAARAHDDDARAHELLGAVLAARRPQGLAQARLELTRATQLDPADSRALERLAFVERALGEKRAALEHAQAAVALNPANAESLDELAAAYVANGNCAGALAAEQRALDLLHDGDVQAIDYLQSRLRDEAAACAPRK